MSEKGPAREQSLLMPRPKNIHASSVEGGRRTGGFPLAAFGDTKSKMRGSLCLSRKRSWRVFTPEQL